MYTTSKGNIMASFANVTRTIINTDDPNMKIIRFTQQCPYAIYWQERQWGMDHIPEQYPQVRELISNGYQWTGRCTPDLEAPNPLGSDILIEIDFMLPVEAVTYHLLCHPKSHFHLTD